MANHKVVDADKLDADLASVADTIREKTAGGEALTFPDGFVAAISSIEQGGEDVVLQSKSVTPTKASQEVTADEGYTALEKVTVEAIPSEYIVPSGDLAITENGTFDVKQYESVEVNVPSEEPILEEITITENGEYTPSGDGYSKVTVEVEGGGGECDLPHIIEVDVLPTENIDKESIYEVKTSFEDVVMFFGDEASSLKAQLEQEGGQFTANVIPTRTTENIQETNLATFIIHAYYIEDENDTFGYGDFTGSGNPVWLSLSSLTKAPFRGIITDVSQATIDGYYLLGRGGGYYKYFDASFDDIVSNGESLGAMMAGMYYESTKPTENIQASDLNNVLLYLYYIADENDIFLYTEGQWEALESGSFGGTITDISEAVNPEYYYAVVTPAGLQQLLIPSGTLTITENGTFDVAGKSAVNVKVTVPQVFMVQTVDDLSDLDHADYGSLAYVLGGD